MIVKLDEAIRFQTGKKTEEDFQVVELRVREDPLGVQLHVNVTPLYCLRCNMQLPHLYYLGGSRYGHVGSLECDRCGAHINCIDSDYIVVEYLDTYTSFNDKELGKLTIDYRELYHLHNPIWDLIKAKTGFAIGDTHKGDQWIPLGTVLNEICAQVSLDLSSLAGDVIVTSRIMTTLPGVVNRWLLLLRHLQVV